MPDEGFHEIQLNGKQLVFLFMAATVVSVVIFLCGVLVGRGVRTTERTDAAVTASGVAPDAGTPGATAATPAAPPSETPPAPPDELSYHERLEGQETPPETLKPRATEETSAPPAPAPAAAVVETPPEPQGAGFAVQVAALRERREADAIVQRLIGKGYPAYVLAPAKGAPAAVYRVRVGKFMDRREAEEAARRLEKEEQFKPWIVR